MEPLAAGDCSANVIRRMNGNIKAWDNWKIDEHASGLHSEVCLLVCRHQHETRHETDAWRVTWRDVTWRWRRDVCSARIYFIESVPFQTCLFAARLMTRQYSLIHSFSSRGDWYKALMAHLLHSYRYVLLNLRTHLWNCTQGICKLYLCWTIFYLVRETAGRVTVCVYL